MSVPTDLSNLLYWRDIDHAFKDAGSTPANTTADLIQQFTDRSGNGFHMVQTTSGNRADVQTVGGLLAARFNNGQFYTMGNPFGVGGTPITAGELFWLLRVPAGTLTNGFNVTSNVGGGANNSVHPYVDNYIYDDNLTTVRKDQIGQVTRDAWYVYNIRSKDGRWSAWNNSGRIYDTFTNTFSATAAPIFGHDVLVDAYWTGYLREDFAFGRELTDSERFAMMDYLARDLTVGSLRSTHETLEVLAAPSNSNMRSTHETLEILTLPSTAFLRTTHETIEVLAQNLSRARSCAVQVIG